MFEFLFGACGFVAGVGHLAAWFRRRWSVVLIAPVPYRPRTRGPSQPFSESTVLGVCQDEDPFPLMRGANVTRRESEPFRIEPEVGQVPENFSELPSSIR